MKNRRICWGAKQSKMRERRPGEKKQLQPEVTRPSTSEVRTDVLGKLSPLGGTQQQGAYALGDLLERGVRI